MTHLHEHSYGFSIDGKFYPVANLPSHHGAEEAGRTYYGPEATFFTARLRRVNFEPYFHPDDVIENLELQAKTQGAKYASETFLEKLSVQQKLELGNLLSVVTRGWLEKHGLTSGLSGVVAEDVREHKPK